MQSLSARLSTLLAAVLPVPCAGCGRPGGALCPACATQCTPSPRSRALDRGLEVQSALDYEGVPRRALLAFKNAGRTELGGTLGAALAVAVAAAIRHAAERPIVLVPMPSTRRSRRERGYDPVRVLLRRARLPSVRALHAVHRSADQVTLGREGRAANMAGTMAARIRPGTAVLLVDDVVTTGATLREAARAVAAAGAVVVGAATVASTPLRSA